MIKSALLDDTNTIISIIAGLIAIGGAVGGFIYRRNRRRLQQKTISVEKLNPIDLERLGVKRSFHLPLPQDQVITRIGAVLEPECFLLNEEKSGKNMGDFVKSPVYFLRRREPKKYDEIRKMKPNMDEFVAEVLKSTRFRATTPTELKVRLVSQFENETYCEAECYPDLYFDLITGKSNPQDESEKVVKLAQNQCRMLVDDMVARLGGRVKSD